MRVVGERRHVLHVPVGWDFNEGGGGGGGGRNGGRVHPGCSGLGEVGRMDWGVEGSEVRLGVVGAKGAVCSEALLVEIYRRGSEIGMDGSSRRTVGEAVFYQEFDC